MLKFTKMHSLGNDFMVIDGLTQVQRLSAAQWAELANRRTGVGFDQGLLVEKSARPGVDFFYRIFNADGSEVGQCGNGARCLARFIYEKGLSKQRVLQLETNTTRLSTQLHDNNQVSVSFDKPQFEADAVPILVKSRADRYPLLLKSGQVVEGYAVNVGNPHLVLPIEDWSAISVPVLGRELSEHPAFPQQTNVDFMKVRTPALIELKVYERGSGETLACGSAAVATAVIARKYFGAEATILLKLPGGELTVACPDPQASSVLTGPAVFVFDGEVLGGS